ncbi:hypothetical protein [Melissococcus sp. OM08-11BH]|uniref:hypothetical protein n=1 Tax=Melissococcus sp. OM08-11BH TaxID=2293110 RepID=UPI000E5418CD|nr:hypothetical protein [Melissococcus sp. OM08-11BH]RGI30860.1 hypothetical protein DXC12_04485 [Melissococcus sp. OM08-11BH]
MITENEKLFNNVKVLFGDIENGIDEYAELKEVVDAFYQDYKELTSNKEKYGDRQVLGINIVLAKHCEDSNVYDIEAEFKTDIIKEENGKVITEFECLMSELKWNSKAEVADRLFKQITADAVINVPVDLFKVYN